MFWLDFRVVGELIVGDEVFYLVEGELLRSRLYEVVVLGFVFVGFLFFALGILEGRVVKKRSVRVI